MISFKITLHISNQINGSQKTNQALLSKISVNLRLSGYWAYNGISKSMFKHEVGKYCNRDK